MRLRQKATTSRVPCRVSARTQRRRQRYRRLAWDLIPTCSDFGTSLDFPALCSVTHSSHSCCGGPCQLKPVPTSDAHDWVCFTCRLCHSICHIHFGVASQVLGEPGFSCTDTCNFAGLMCVGSSPAVHSTDALTTLSDMLGVPGANSALVIETSYAPGFYHTGQRVYAKSTSAVCDAADPSIARIWYVSPILRGFMISLLFSQLLWFQLPSHVVIMHYDKAKLTSLCRHFELQCVQLSHHVINQSLAVCVRALVLGFRLICSSEQAQTW